METVSFATSNKGRAAQNLDMIRGVLARTGSFSATARQTGFPELTIRELVEPPKRRETYISAATPAPKPVAMPLPSPTALSAKEVIMLCCAEEGLSYADITSQDRRRTFARPRQRFMWLMRKAKPNLSLPEIARRFNKLDHTTVIHALQVTEARYQTDPVERAKMDALVAALSEVESPMNFAAELDASIAAKEIELAALKAQRAAITAQYRQAA